VLDRLKKRKEAILAAQSAMDEIDKDGGGDVDLDELEEFLSATADARDIFNVKDAKELLAKFDKDDTGRLDRAELEEMKAALRAKRSDVEKEEEDVKKKMEAANKNSKKGGGGGMDAAMGERLLKLEGYIFALSEKMEGVIEKLETVYTAVGGGDEERELTRKRMEMSGLEGAADRRRRKRQEGGKFSATKSAVAEEV